MKLNKFIKSIFKRFSYKEFYAIKRGVKEFNENVVTKYIIDKNKNVYEIIEKADYELNKQNIEKNYDEFNNLIYNENGRYINRSDFEKRLISNKVYAYDKKNYIVSFLIKHKDNEGLVESFNFNFLHFWDKKFLNKVENKIEKISI